MDERQREYFLREQLKAIQQALGEGEAGNAAEIEELRKSIEAAQMPEEVDRQALKELKRLQHMPDESTDRRIIQDHHDSSLITGLVYRQIASAGDLPKTRGGPGIAPPFSVKYVASFWP
ncbi:hypothetical protein [Azoarcus sp. KH32C]|uniref:hypothetical protein n=1 Tax=Azoarcus sp. KH32C TaxID=748247 RepID=UPI00034A58E3|nr:hypothetical protein [Azoarcus sp. KH32C]